MRRNSLNSTLAHLLQAREANYKQRMDWGQTRDDQAYGHDPSPCKIPPGGCCSKQLFKPPKPLWEALHAAFGTTGPSAIFADFKNAISKKISAANSRHMTSWRCMRVSSALRAATIVIPESGAGNDIAKCNAKKSTTESHKPPIQTTEQSKLTFNYVRDAIPNGATAASRLNQPVQTDREQAIRSQAERRPTPNGRP